MTIYVNVKLHVNKYPKQVTDFPSVFAKIKNGSLIRIKNVQLNQL